MRRASNNVYTQKADDGLLRRRAYFRPRGMQRWRGRRRRRYAPGGGDDHANRGGTTTTTTTTTTPPVLTELATAQAAAETAAVAAETASGEAAESLAKAVMAGENHATLQTKSPTTGALVDEDVVADAMEYAAKALAESVAARAAATKAAGTESVTEAVEARIAAQTAQTAAVKAAEAAAKAAEAAEMAAMAELKIDGTVKSVGETKIDATAGYNEVIAGGKVIMTGLIGRTQRPRAPRSTRLARNWTRSAENIAACLIRGPVCKP